MAFNRLLTLFDSLVESGITKHVAGKNMKVFSSAFFVMAIQSVRCDGMRLMLLAENCSIRQAAEACGFSNRAHFYRMYRRFVKHLPSMEAKAEHNL